jgi:hypothetical protein
MGLTTEGYISIPFSDRCSTGSGHTEPQAQRITEREEVSDPLTRNSPWTLLSFLAICTQSEPNPLYTFYMCVYVFVCSVRPIDGAALSSECLSLPQWFRNVEAVGYAVSFVSLI